MRHNGVSRHEKASPYTIADVLPVDDFGVRKVAQMAYGLKELPKPRMLIEIAEPWRPWRTVGTWYLWRYGAAVAREKPQGGLPMD